MTRTEILLTQMAEECNEIAQRVSKAIRFGLLEVQEGQEKTNAARIIQEFRDLQAVMELLEDAGALEKCVWARNVAAIEAKKAKVAAYLEHSRACGVLEERCT